MDRTARARTRPDWACIRQHESGDNYAEPGGGAYQFELGTWQSLTGLPAPAEDYSAAVQDSAALRLFAERGLGALDDPVRLRPVDSPSEGVGYPASNMAVTCAMSK